MVDQKKCIEAMEAASRAAEGLLDPEIARTLAREILASPETIVDSILDQPSPVDAAALLTSVRKIARVPVLLQALPEPSQSPWDQRIYETVALAWIKWAAGDQEAIPQEVGRIPANPAQEVSSLTHMLALQNWSAAVLDLGKQNPEQSKRFWRRAIEVGSSFGTPSHPIILWSYAASFLPD